LKPLPETGTVVDLSFQVFVQQPCLPGLDLFLEVEGGEIHEQVSKERKIPLKIEGIPGDGFQEVEVEAVFFGKLT
jgi:hypothetical protein